MVTNIPISCNCTPGPYFYVNCHLVNHMKIYQEVLHTVVSPLFHNDCPNLFLKLDTHAILVLPLPICCLNLTTGIPPPKSSPNNKGSYLYLELEKEGKKSTFSTVLKKGTSLIQKSLQQWKNTASTAGLLCYFFNYRNVKFDTRHVGALKAPVQKSSFSIDIPTWPLSPFLVKKVLR